MVVVRQERVDNGRDPDRTRKAILDAAKELIASEGVDAVSVSSVARLANVNRGTAYLHFKDRDELMDATISSVVSELNAAIRKVSTHIQDWTPGDDSVMEAIAKTLGNNTTLVKVVFQEMIMGETSHTDELWEIWQEGLKSLRDLPNVSKDIDFEVLAVIGVAGSFLWPIVTDAENMSKAKRDRSSKRFAAAFDRIVLEGILKRP